MTPRYLIRSGENRSLDAPHSSSTPEEAGYESGVCSGEEKTKKKCLIESLEHVADHA
jgi:hypothetical protein